MESENLNQLVKEAISRVFSGVSAVLGFEIMSEYYYIFHKYYINMWPICGPYHMDHVTWTISQASYDLSILVDDCNHRHEAVQKK